jgi:uncharacterized RDD family membrane protein YckC
MTEPTGGTPPLPPQEPPASAPPPVAAPAPATPAPAAAASSWQVPPASAGATAAGPAPGIAYAGLGVRIVALIIDYILLLIVFTFVAIALGSIFLGSLINGGGIMAIIAGVLLAVANLAISAVYFIWAWTKPDLRASLGQRVLGLNTVSATDGATVTRPQAVQRWVYLFGLVALASAMQSALSATSLGTLAYLIGLLAFAYEIFLLWTTYQSPKKQGYHDVQAGTVVIKRG